jgi:polyisoprenoid-binding protein YceI
MAVPMKPLRLTILAAVIACAVAASPPSDVNLHPFDVAHSKMTVYVYKQGMFSFAADNHEIAAPLASGSYESATGAVELTVDATKMQVLDPSLSSGRRDDIQSNMAGLQVLDVEKYPTIAFRSTNVETDSSGALTVTGDLTLHGQTHSIVVQAHKVDPTHFSGSVMLRQSTFGITPIRLVGGTVQVKDDVKIVFEIALAQ